MNAFEQFLYQIKVLKFTESKLRKWNDQNKLDNLIFAAQNGLYNIRLVCANLFLEHLNLNSVNKQLRAMIFDDVEIVSEAAIKAFENFDNEELEEQIRAVRENRKLKTQKPRGKYHSNIKIGEMEEAKPRERLMEKHRSRQRANHPPFGI